jgi:hypothetical protein
VKSLLPESQLPVLTVWGTNDHALPSMEGLCPGHTTLTSSSACTALLGSDGSEKISRRRGVSVSPAIRNFARSIVAAVPITASTRFVVEYHKLFRPDASEGFRYAPGVHRCKPDPLTATIRLLRMGSGYESWLEPACTYLVE